MAALPPLPPHIPLTDFTSTLAVALNPTLVFDTLATLTSVEGIGGLRATLANRNLLVSAIGCEPNTGHVFYTSAAKFTSDPLAHLRGHKVKIPSPGQPPLLLSYPFLKFFDAEPDTISLADIGSILGASSLSFAEKVDGSILKLTLLDDKDGGEGSDRVLVESQKTTLSRSDHLFQYLLQGLPFSFDHLASRMEPHTTYVVEVTHPDLPSTVIASAPGVTLLGAVSHPPAYGMRAVDEAGARLGLPVPANLLPELLAATGKEEEANESPMCLTFEELYAFVNARDGGTFEGGILSFLDGERNPLFMVKIKNTHWNALHGLSHTSDEGLLVQLSSSHICDLAGIASGSPLSTSDLQEYCTRLVGPLLIQSLDDAFANLATTLDTDAWNAIVGCDMTDPAIASGNTLHTTLSHVGSLPSALVSMLCTFVRKRLPTPLPPTYTLSSEFAAYLAHVLRIGEGTSQKGQPQAAKILRIARALLGLDGSVVSPIIEYPARCGRTLPQLSKAQVLSLCLSLSQLSFTDTVSSGLSDENNDDMFVPANGPEMAEFERLMDLLPGQARPFGSFVVAGHRVRHGSDIDVLTTAPLDALLDLLDESPDAWALLVASHTFVPDAAYPVVTLTLASGLEVDVVHAESEWGIMDANSAVRSSLVQAGGDGLCRAMLAFTEVGKACHAFPSSMHGHMMFLSAAVALGLIPSVEPGVVVEHEWVGDLVAPFFPHRPVAHRGIRTKTGGVGDGRGGEEVFDAVVGLVVDALQETQMTFSVLDERGVFAAGSGDGGDGGGDSGSDASLILGESGAIWKGSNVASRVALQTTMKAAVASGRADVVVVFDFDGTLYVESSGTGFEPLIQHLAWLTAAGVPVFVLTGRVQAEIGPIYKTLAPAGVHATPVFARVSSRQSAVVFKSLVLQSLVAQGILDPSISRIVQYEDQVNVGAALYGPPCGSFDAIRVSTVIVDQDSTEEGGVFRHFTPRMAAGGAGGSGVIRVCIPGEPGIGRTGLIQDVAAEVARRGGEAVHVALLSNDEIQQSMGGASITRELKRLAEEACEEASAKGVTAVLLYDNRGSDKLISDASWMIFPVAGDEGGYAVMDALAYLGVLDRPDHASIPLDLGSVVESPSKEGWASYEKAVRRVHARIRDGKYAHGNKMVSGAQKKGSRIVRLPLLNIEQMGEPEWDAVGVLKHLFSGRRKGNPFATCDWQERLAALVEAMGALDGLHARVWAEGGASMIADSILEGIVGGVEGEGGEGEMTTMEMGGVMSGWRYRALTLPGFRAALSEWWPSVRDGLGDEDLVRAVEERMEDESLKYHVTLQYQSEWRESDVDRVGEGGLEVFVDGVQVQFDRVVAGRFGGGGGACCLDVSLEGYNGGVVGEEGRRLHVTLGVYGEGVSAKDSVRVLDESDEGVGERVEMECEMEEICGVYAVFE